MEDSDERDPKQSSVWDRVPPELQARILHMAFEGGIPILHSSSSPEMRDLSTILTISRPIHAAMLNALLSTSFLISADMIEHRQLPVIHARFARKVRKLEIELPRSTFQRQDLLYVFTWARYMKTIRHCTIYWTEDGDVWYDVFAKRRTALDSLRRLPCTCTLRIPQVGPMTEAALQRDIEENGEDWSRFEQVKDATEARL